MNSALVYDVKTGYRAIESSLWFTSTTIKAGDPYYPAIQELLPLQIQKTGTQTAPSNHL